MLLRSHAGAMIRRRNDTRSGAELVCILHGFLAPVSMNGPGFHIFAVLRSILSIVLGIGDAQVCVAASHLESPSPAPGIIAKMQLSRQSQLETVCCTGFALCCGPS